jgi:phosphoribosylaminoimidazole-succinocarboxamide synthase
VSARLLRSGKVREVYEEQSGTLLMVATDRVSAYDHVFPELVPDKGRLLTAISATAFGMLTDLVPTHFVEVPIDLPPNLVGRTTRVRRLQMLPIECVVRGYLVGSAYEAYQASGEVQGLALPEGLGFGDRLPEPIFTPTTKEETGHDQPLTPQELADRLGGELAERLARRSLSIYARLADWFNGHGLVLLDTKFEFGLDDGDVVLADEVATPDSSRIVRAPVTREPEWLDKQILRDWLRACGFRGDGPPPALDGTVLAALRGAYVTVYETLSGRSFADWPGLAATYGGGS